jgi:hypothetical protein
VLSLLDKVDKGVLSLLDRVDKGVLSLLDKVDRGVLLVHTGRWHEVELIRIEWRTIQINVHGGKLGRNFEEFWVCESLRKSWTLSFEGKGSSCEEKRKILMEMNNFDDCNCF